MSVSQQTGRTRAADGTSPHYLEITEGTAVRVVQEPTNRTARTVREVFLGFEAQRTLYVINFMCNITLYIERRTRLG